MNSRRTAPEGTATLEKALDLLEAVAASSDGLSQADLAARLAMPRTTVYRLLASLVMRGFLRRDARRRVYCPGPKCYELVRQWHDRPELVAAASMEMHALRDLTGETTYLAVREGMQVLVLERCDGAHPVRSQASLGHSKPLHATSQGKAILSAMAPRERESLVRQMTLSPQTEKTIVDRKKLLEELQLTATRRWSLDDEEIITGVRCIGAPIVDQDGMVRGAISIAGPAFRMTLDRIRGLGAEVAEAARRIGQQLRSQKQSTNPPLVQALAGPWAFRGIGPQWFEERQALYWADGLAPALRVWENGEDKTLSRFDTPILCIYPQADSVTVCCESGIWRVDLSASGHPAVLCDSWRTHLKPTNHSDSERNLAVNDSIPLTPISAWCQEANVIWVCHAANKSYQGYVIRRIVLHSNELADNGFIWNLTEPVSDMYWDRKSQSLLAITQSGHEILRLTPNRNAAQRFASIPSGSGKLRGLCVDAQGGVWTGLSGGWSALRFDTNGAQERVVGLPIPNPTGIACVNDSVYVTSSREGLSFDELSHAPASGCLFQIMPIPKVS